VTLFAAQVELHSVHTSISEGPGFKYRPRRGFCCLPLSVYTNVWIYDTTTSFHILTQTCCWIL